jgi:hypothetical protein
MTDDNYGHDILFGPEKQIGGEGNMTVFRLSTKLSDASTNNKIMACADDMRAAADAFPQYNITTYTPMWNLADQLCVILPQTLQNIVIDIGQLVGAEFITALANSAQRYAPRSFESKLLLG